MLTSLKSLSFSASDGTFIVREEYASMIFSTTKYLNMFIQKRREYFQEILGIDLGVSPSYLETLKLEHIKTVFELSGKQKGLGLKDVLEKTKREDNVLARWYAMKICHDRGLTDSIIGEAIGFDRNTVRHGRGMIDGFLAVDSQEAKEYLRVMDYVLHSLNGYYNENGSGQKT